MANQDQIAAMLGTVDLFSDLSDKVRKRLAKTGRQITFEAGRAVTEEGGSGVGFHLVLDGDATVDIHGASRPTLTPGDYFGEISLLDGLPRSATVTAGPTGLTTLALTSWEFSPILDEHPEVSRALLKSLCARLRAAEANRGD